MVTKVSSACYKNCPLVQGKGTTLSSVLPTFEATVEHASRLMEASEGFQEHNNVGPVYGYQNSTPTMVSNNLPVGIKIVNATRILIFGEDVSIHDSLLSGSITF